MGLRGWPTEALLNDLFLSDTNIAWQPRTAKGGGKEKSQGKKEHKHFHIFWDSELFIVCECEREKWTVVIGLYTLKVHSSGDVSRIDLKKNGHVPYMQLISVQECTCSFLVSRSVEENLPWTWTEGNSSTINHLSCTDCKAFWYQMKFTLQTLNNGWIWRTVWFHLSFLHIHLLRQICFITVEVEAFIWSQKF